jgi:hypothetical protein
VRFAPKRVIFDPREDFGTSEVINTTGIGLYDDLNDEGIHEVIVQTSDDLIAAFDITCRELVDWIRAHREQSFGFLVDDSRLMLTSKQISPDFSWMLRSTKVDQSRIVMTTWRIVDIPPEVRSQADHWMVFKTTEPRDLEIIEERFGESAREQVQLLPPHVFLHCDDSGTELKLSVNNNPRSWYIDTHVLQEEPNARKEPSSITA